MVQAPVLPLYFLCVCRVGLTRYQRYIFCSKSWLMVIDLCFASLPYPNSNSSIMSHFKEMMHVSNHALIWHNVVKMLRILKSNYCAILRKILKLCVILNSWLDLLNRGWYFENLLLKGCSHLMRIQKNTHTRRLPAKSTSYVPSVKQSVVTFIYV